MRFIGAILMLALIVPAIAFSGLYPNPTTVNLGSAANFRILAATAITIGSGCTVTGNVGEYWYTLTNAGTITGTTDLRATLQH